MNTERKLVTIRTISNILTIPNCDNIVLSIIDGWSVITKISEFSIGDSCVFFEIDSFLPEDPRYTFLKLSTFNTKPGHRIKSMKMKGVISQGLALPLSMFPEVDPTSKEDLAPTLGVIKYDNDTFLGGSNVGKTAGNFPSFIPKTDQPRIQNLPHYFTSFTNETFEETLKLDGSSMTCYKVPTALNFFQKFLSFFKSYPKYHFGVCSRNQELKRTESSDFWATAIKLDIESKIPVGFAIQGEIIGPKIQSNHEKVQELDYFVFDVFNIQTGDYLLPDERQAFCKTYNIQHVPVMNKASTPCSMSLTDLLASVETESINPKTISEGRVFKHTTLPVSFKVISNKYLIKSEN